MKYLAGSLLVLLLVVGTETTTPTYEELVSRLDDHVTRGHVRAHCRRHAVIIDDETRVMTSSPSRGLAHLVCSELDREMINFRLCEEDCVDPHTCQPVPGFRNQPVLTTHVLNHRREGRILLKLPVACRCVAVHPATGADLARVRKCFKPNPLLDDDRDQ